MINAPWQILAWSQVSVPAHSLAWLAQALQHLDTTVEVTAEHSARMRWGQALWGSDGMAHARMAIAFEWGEVYDRVPTLADPMSIVTNVLFTDDRGNALEACHQVVCLNTVIHEIPWQDRVPARAGVLAQTLWRDTLPKAA